AGGMGGWVGLRLRWLGWEKGAPQAGWSVRRHLEAVAPRAGVGEIAARAIAALAFEVIRRGEDDEALGPGEALERDAALLAHHAAAPVGTDQGDAGVTSQPAGTADLAAHGICGLQHADDLMIEQDVHIGKRAQPLEQELGGLELLALHDEGMACVVLEDRVIELGDELAGRPIPELEDWRDESYPRHVIGKSVVLEQIERRRMGGGRARVGLQRGVLVEQYDRHAAASEQPRAQEPDRAAARDQHLLSWGCHGYEFRSSPRKRGPSSERSMRLTLGSRLRGNERWMSDMPISCFRRSNGSRTAGSHARI